MVYIKQKGREVWTHVYQTICEALLYYADSGTFMAVFFSIVPMFGIVMAFQDYNPVGYFAF